MNPTDEIYTPKQKEPERAHFVIFDGKYYTTSMDEYYKYVALYGIPAWEWSYTNHQAIRTIL